MVDVDTSSYLKPAALPAQKSLLDNVQQMGALQQQKQAIDNNALTIDKQKLDLVNQRFGEMSKGFAALATKPDLSQDDIQKYLTDQVKLGYIPPEMAATTLTNLPPNATPAQLKQHLLVQMQHAQTVVDAINTHAGQNVNVDQGDSTIVGNRASALKGGAITPIQQVNTQLPPGTPTIDQNPKSPTYQSPGLMGPAGPGGIQPYAGASTVAPPAAAPPRLSQSVQPPVGPSPGPVPGPITSPAIPGQSSNFGGNVVGATAEPATFAQRFVPTGLAPGVQEATREVAGQSGKDMAVDLARAKNFQSDLYPMTHVLDIVKQEGPKAFGPGTDSLNEVKSALATWLPSVDQKTLDGISNYQQAKKYLVQAARTAGNTGTNDQLAAAFDASPNVTMNSATIEAVLKSNIALRKMQHAQTLLAQEKGVTPDKYSKWIASNQNVLDPRAFGFDMMDDNARKKLIDSMATVKDGKLVAKPGKENDYKKFEYSLQFAHDANLIEPPSKK